MELNKEVKQQILLNKIAYWQQTVYSLELDAKVANVIKDDKMLENVKASLKNALSAMETLQTELDELAA